MFCISLSQGLLPHRASCCHSSSARQSVRIPNGQGNPEFHANIVGRWLLPTMLTAQVTVPVLDTNGNPERDEQGKPIVEPKYKGLHAFRHFFASWCINRK